MYAIRSYYGALGPRWRSPATCPSGATETRCASDSVITSYSIHYTKLYEALAFGLAASSFFPILVLGIFSKRVNRQGAIAGMVAGIGFTMLYIVQTKFLGVKPWLMGISPEGIGAVGMCLNFAVTFLVSNMTPPPPQEIQDLVESVRIPKGAGAAVDH